MAQRCPFAEWDPLGPQTQGRMTSHDVVCLHTMVGTLAGTDGYFTSGNGAGYLGTESHYGVGGKWGADATRGWDGHVKQWQDRAYIADANLQGKYRVISVETADNAARPIQPWTPAQCESLARIIAWESSTAAHADCPTTWQCHQTGIPISLVPDSKPGRRGVAYHRQGVDPWRVDGGEWWSESDGKDCPTQARIDQIPGILARARQIAGGATPTPQEDDMNDLDRFMLTQLWQERGGMQETLAGVRALLKAVGAIPEQIAAAGAPDVDETALAAQIAGAIPADLAAQVADELAKRLAS